MSKVDDFKSALNDLKLVADLQKADPKVLEALLENIDRFRGIVETTLIDRKRQLAAEAEEQRLAEEQRKLEMEVLRGEVEKLTEVQRRIIEFFGEKGEGGIADYYQVSVEAWEEIQEGVKVGLIERADGTGDPKFKLTEKGQKLYQAINFDF
ncbi:hypothetical protein KJ742_05330 [Patescibacteria group bacterium]|nr:hypothetical protein [Patescibacteria group bacterium]